MDIKIKKNSHLFKVRTSGIIMKDNKILVEQYRDTSYFTLPGGYVENDNGIIINHHFKWIELQKLTDYDIRPKCIIPYLRNEQNTSFHLVQRETD